MRRGPEPPRRFPLAIASTRGRPIMTATTTTITAVRRPAFICKRPRRLAVTRRIPGGYMTCTAMSGSGPVRPIRINMMVTTEYAQIVPQPAGRCGAARASPDRCSCAPPSATCTFLLYGSTTTASVSPRTNFLYALLFFLILFFFLPFPAKPAIFFLALSLVVIHKPNIHVDAYRHPDDELPYGNPRITSLPEMLSVFSWQPSQKSRHFGRDAAIQRLGMAI